MRPQRVVTQDTVAGLMFAAWGGAALYFGRSYHVGAAYEMGPGYFPTVLGWALIGIGAIIAINGLAKFGQALEPLPLRAMIFISCAFLLVAVLIERLGLLITGPLCMLLAAFGTREFRTREQVAAALVFSFFAVAVLIWLLKLPLPLLPVL
jgi:hypothetical protein